MSSMDSEILKSRDWMKQEDEAMKLELRLGPPGSEDCWAEMKEKSSQGSCSEDSLVAVGCPKKFAKCSGSNFGGKMQVLLGSGDCKNEGFQHCGFVELVQERSVKIEQMSVEKKARVPASCTTPVIGWPPIRSFRKNLASASNSKPSPSSHKETTEPKAKLENPKNLLVKINMEGVPIGRKVDLKAYDSYEKLSLAVDELFGGLLAAQTEPLGTGNQKAKEKEMITCLLDGSGEYTLVYEDDEGDRMLVGDLPWDMFVSTAKRLRVLKTSELYSSASGSVSRKRTANEC